MTAARIRGKVVRPWSVRTRDGRKLKVRLLEPNDTALLIDLFLSLSPESKWRRFNYALDDVAPKLLREYARRLANVDNRNNGGAILALEDVEGEERAVGVARLMRPEGDLDSPEVEAAITIRDDYQRLGLGSEMVAMLVPLAQRMHAQSIVANIAADNKPAIRVFRKLNLPMEVQTSQGETTLRISVPPHGRKRGKSTMPAVTAL